MIKNWLIRTKNNHILGPVSKQKIQELLDNGSIKGDDEICCGNGYWIYVREEDLIERYVHNDESQGFNPVQEAESCDVAHFPLDYSLLKNNPGEANTQNQVNNTLIQKNPLLVEENQIAETEQDETSAEKKNTRIIKRKKVDMGLINKNQIRSNLTVNFLYLFIILFIGVILFSLWKRETLFDSLKALVINQIIPEARAQSLGDEKKKFGIKHQYLKANFQNSAMK